jgi:hypothetical protein
MTGLLDSAGHLIDRSSAVHLAEPARPTWPTTVLPNRGSQRATTQTQGQLGCVLTGEA